MSYFVCKCVRCLLSIQNVGWVTCTQSLTVYGPLQGRPLVRAFGGSAGASAKTITTSCFSHGHNKEYNEF